MLQRTLLGIFTLTLALSLAGGILLVLAQGIVLLAGQGPWLTFLNDTAKIPVIIASSVCAIAGFLLSYRKTAPVEATVENSHT
jgi:hypothetical protein